MSRPGGSAALSGTDDGEARPVRARIDMHCHSGFSKDALGTLDEIAVAARAKGLDGVCLTEHNTLAHHRAVADWNDDHPGAFRFYAGCEVSARGGHVLAVGIDEQVPLGRSVLETVTRIHDQGGVAIAAHPFRRGSGIGEKGLASVRKELYAVEVFNAQELGNRSREAASWALANGKGGTGGSDCHQVHDVGNGYTEFLSPIRDTADLLEALRSGDTWGLGHRTALSTLIRQGSRNLVRRATGRL